MIAICKICKKIKLVIDWVCEDCKRKIKEKE